MSTTFVARVKPGILVSLGTSNRGNTSYTREVIEYPTEQDDGSVESEMNVRKRVADPDEQRSAEKIRNRARTLILRPCSKSKGWYICPLDRRDELEKGIADARQLVNDFNSMAIYNHIQLNLICGEVQQDDVEAAKTIFNKVGEFMRQMEIGLEKLDVKRVRQIANEAQNVGQMLDGEAKAELEEVIKAARGAATRIKKRGDAIVGEMERSTIRLIAESRTAFLDLDSADEIAEPVSGAGRSLELVI